jgi:nucleotide-binding universal stress UspA family protein
MYRNILVPLDGSEFSECSLKHVQAIAKGCNVPVVTLLTVMEQPPYMFPSEGGNQSQVEAMVREQEQMRTQAMDNANKYLTKASGNLRLENINVKTDIVQAPENQGVADVILEYADNSSADLIIMSTHGRSGISRWALGSIADRIVRSAKSPVLTVSPSGCRL